MNEPEPDNMAITITAMACLVGLLALGCAVWLALGGSVS